MAAGLVLFMTQGMSLAAWEELGILERELAVYRALDDRVGGVAVATYGGEEERAYGIPVLINRLGLPARLYAGAMPSLHRNALPRAGVLKTNQILGGHAAAHAARRYRRPLIARAGFLWSEAAAADHGPRSLRTRAVIARERRILRAADVVVVTTERLREVVRGRYGLERVRVIPNYVDTAAFIPRPDVAPEPGALAFVGRLAPEKNVLALLEALAGRDGGSLTLVGDGPQRAELEGAARRLGVDARFLGRRGHAELPVILARCEAFALPSLYEGHPKAAIEAMACGLPVIGADVPGVREVVADGETGVLARAPDARALRAAIEQVLGDAGLRARLGAAAREAALVVSLDRVVELELEAIEEARAACPA